jgi:hypothetical protein
VVKSWGCTVGPFIPYPLMLVRILGAPEVGRNHTGWGVSPSKPPPTKFLRAPSGATPDCSSQVPAERMSPPLEAESPKGKKEMFAKPALLGLTPQPIWISPLRGSERGHGRRTSDRLIAQPKRRLPLGFVDHLKDGFLPPQGDVLGAGARSSWPGPGLMSRSTDDFQMRQYLLK